MSLESNVADKNNQNTSSRFSDCGVLLTPSKAIPPPPSIAVETGRPSGAAIGLDTGASHGFGTEENDWLGAEAYIDPVR
jgi:hypothetical protein